jgi:hypothetical protein
MINGYLLRDILNKVNEILWSGRLLGRDGLVPEGKKIGSRPLPSALSASTLSDRLAL